MRSVNVTPVTYMLDGKQFLSLLAGAPVGSRLYTFVLDGKAPIPQPAAPAETGAAISAEATDGDLRKLVVRRCTVCHVLDVVTNTRLSHDSWKNMVDNMVERGATGTPQELNTIVDYLSKQFGAQ